MNSRRNFHMESRHICVFHSCSSYVNKIRFKDIYHSDIYQCQMSVFNLFARNNWQNKYFALNMCKMLLFAKDE